MSDISIPGVKSKYDTQKLIEDLMKVERIPKESAEKDLERMQKETDVWRGLGVKMSKLRESSRSLFSYNNPFSERVANSSDEMVLTATASREAIEETKSFTVKQLAQADRFLSNKLAKDYKVPSGAYQFSVGNQSVNIQFSGGSLKEFSDVITQRGKGLIASQVLTVERGSQTLLIESLKTGSANRLSFGKAAETLALDSGMVERSLSSERRLSLDESQLSKAKAADPSKLSLGDGVLTLSPGAEIELPINPEIAPKGNMVLEYKIMVRPLAEAGAEMDDAKGPVIPAVGSMEYMGVRIDNDPVYLPTGDYTPPEPKKVVDDLSIAYAKLGPSGERSLGQSQESGDFSIESVPLSSLGASLSGLGFRNRNSGREVLVKEIRIYDPNQVGGFKPKQAVSSAQDALLAMDGIEFRRDKNDVDDVLPGVTLHVHDTSDKAVKIKVTPDVEGSKQGLIQWVGYYNQLMTEVNILSRKDEKVISELDYLSEDDKKSAKERLGSLQSDFSVSQIKNSLQRVTMNAYETDLRNELSLLSQVGISTDAQKSGGSSGYDPARLRGYLEVDEKKLDAALSSKIGGIKQLFGNDLDGDLIVDSGIGFQLDSLIKAYVETGGILALKQNTLSGQMDRQKKKIETLETQLTQKEKDLKRKYGMMESSLNQLERSSDSIENFNRKSE